jgi:HSP20 family molecular chaperone IbpA
MTETETKKTTEQEWRTPYCDILERKDCFEIILDMPGIKEENLEITFQGGTLNITGKICKCKKEGLEVMKLEYIPVDFKREFTISEQNIAIDKINAELKNGELRIKLPKSENVKPRKIEIKCAE